MANKKLLLLCMTALLLLASGCAAANIDELLIAPQLPGEYEQLKQELSKIRGSGAVSAVPELGERQAVKLIDLDADGVDEAVAFFRTESGGYSMYVFRWQEGHYQLVGSEEGSGYSLRAFYLPRSSAEGNRVLAVSWSLDESSSAFGVSVFGYDGQELFHMLDMQYTNMEYQDVNEDGADELIFIVKDPVTERKLVSIYSLQDSTYKLLSSAPLCVEASSVKNIRFGPLDAWSSALFIDSMTENQNYVTDVISLIDRHAVNETRDPASGQGTLTLRTASVFCQDIDGDGVIDVPASAAFLADSGDPNRNKLNWYHFSEGKIIRTVGTTFHSVNEEWHLLWPEGWDDQVRVKRSNSIHMTRTEFFLPGEGPGKEGEHEAGPPTRPLLYVMIFAGDNAAEYLTQYNAKFLQKVGQKYYCFNLPTDVPEEYALTEEQVRALLFVDTY